MSLFAFGFRFGGASVLNCECSIVFPSLTRVRLSVAPFARKVGSPCRPSCSSAPCPVSLSPPPFPLVVTSAPRAPTHVRGSLAFYVSRLTPQGACCLSQTETGIVAVRLSRLPVSLLPRAVLSVSALFAPPDSFVVVAAIHIPLRLYPLSRGFSKIFPPAVSSAAALLCMTCSASCKGYLARSRVNCV